MYNNFLVNANGGSNSFLLILILPGNKQQERWLYNSSYIATVEVTKYEAKQKNMKGINVQGSIEGSSRRQRTVWLHAMAKSPHSTLHDLLYCLIKFPSNEVFIMYCESTCTHSKIKLPHNSYQEE